MWPQIEGDYETGYNVQGQPLTRAELLRAVHAPQSRVPEAMKRQQSIQVDELEEAIQGDKKLKKLWNKNEKKKDYEFWKKATEKSADSDGDVDAIQYGLQQMMDSKSEAMQEFSRDVRDKHPEKWRVLFNPYNTDRSPMDTGRVQFTPDRQGTSKIHSIRGLPAVPGPEESVQYDPKFMQFLRGV